MMKSAPSLSPALLLAISLAVFPALSAGCGKDKADPRPQPGEPSSAAPDKASPGDSGSILVPVTADSFPHEVMTSGRPVLVVFSASWCGHCRALHSRLGELKPGPGNKARIAKVDIGESSELQSLYGITGVPVVAAFMNGKEVGRFSGARDTETLQALLDTLGTPDASPDQVAAMLRGLAAQDSAGCAVAQGGAPGEGAVCAPSDSP